MIKLNNLSVGYNGIPVLSNVNLKFEDNKIYGILARSGAGKTTLLRTVAGLLKPISGKVIIDGNDHDTNPVYMMHQRYSNFPWLTCVDNVLIAQRNKPLRNCKDAEDILKAVGLMGYEYCYPGQLSGGMQQRLALARTMYVRPRYLLMDEPLSALDDDTRRDMQDLIISTHRSTCNTIVMVTHSRSEAERLCNHIINLEEGNT